MQDMHQEIHDNTSLAITKAFTNINRGESLNNPQLEQNKSNPIASTVKIELQTID